MDDHGRSKPTAPTLYALDTNVLIHDPNALLNFEEHHVAIPMIVLEELDKLKSGHHSVAAECRQAIRLIDKVLGDATPEEVEKGVPIQRGKSGPRGSMRSTAFSRIRSGKRPSRMNLAERSLMPPGKPVWW